MSALVFIYLEGEEHPVLVSGGKISLKKIRKTFRENQGALPNNIVKYIEFRDKTVKTRDIAMATIHDPSKKQNKSTKVLLNNGSVENVPISKEVITREMGTIYSDDKYRTNFIDDNWTILRKISVIEIQ